MPIYKAPLDDIRFAQHELLSELLGTDLPENEALSVEVVDAVLEEAGRVCEQVLLPLNQIGDQQGCRYENGTVSTPDGFKSAYAQFAAGGWTSMAADPEYGGQGLPHHLNVAIEEMMCSANLAFSMYPGLSMGAYRAIRRWGDEDQKQIYLPKLTDGSWSGTMCLTEPHCGTDLGLLRTRAVPMDDGSYAITGTKIFISAGEHDLTDNIVHLVLARTPDAPSGTRGISLFVVPKFLPVSGPDGIGSGQRNGVRCSAIEHKMGINGSATCVLDFDAATGYLVGELHRGMRAMFTMMNAARLGVGVQGLGITEIAYQNAVDYARQRLQGKALDDRADDPERAEAEADPIIRHPDVRRMLLRMRACAEGGRALCTWVSAELDIAERHPDPLVRAAADDLVSLLTPVVKALLTDHGSEVANLALQIHGGHGYIRAQGIEQFVRDARICQIYEGTNGVQALDLVGRKLPENAGRLLRRFFHPIANYIERHQDDPALRDLVQQLAKAFGRLQRATAHVAFTGRSDPNQALCGASDYLRLFGLVALGYVWCRTAQCALRADGGLSAGFYQAKLDTARFYMDRMLPETGALLAGIMADGDTVMGFDEAAF